MTTPLTDAKIAQGWKDTFSTNNPFCPCDLKTFTKAARWAEHALLAQPSVAPPAPGGDVLERRSETGMPMSANAPEKCPITRRPFFMVISHPELGWVPTYGGPYDSYTIPHMEGKPNEPYHERELTCHHYDHDYGGWVDDESIPMRVINEGVLNALQSAQTPTAAAQGQDAAPAEQPQDGELLADTPTPKPQAGLWTLTAPDGRMYQADSPLRCCGLEQRERIPADVAMARIIRASSEPDDSELLDWLDATNKRFKMGWKVSVAPAGNCSVQSVICLGNSEPVTIRAAIRAARAKE